MRKVLFRFAFGICFLMAAANIFCADSKVPTVETKIVSIDKHGNVNLEIQTTRFGVKGFGASDIVNVKVGDFKFTAPIVKNYSDVETGSFLVRIKNEEVSIAINMGNFAEQTGAFVGETVTITMKKQHGYITTYSVRLLSRSDDRADFESDDVFANFRNVPFKDGEASHLYRSTNPLETDVRAPYAEKLLEDNKITAVINLSDSEEKFLSLENVPVYYKSIYDKGNVIFLDMGSSFDSEDAPEKLHALFKFIAEHPGETFLVHGKEGKTRTGYTVAIIQAILGIGNAQIEAEYMQSFQNYYKVKKGTPQYDELVKTVSYMFAGLNNGKEPGKKPLKPIVESYMKDTLKLTKEEIEAVEKNVL